MRNPVNDSLARQAKLAFSRMRPGSELIKRIHALPAKVRGQPHIQQVHQWLTVPFSLLPVDIIGLADRVVTLAEKGRKHDHKLQALFSMIGEAPNARTCDSICEHEHKVQGGNYESLIKAQHKFDDKEKSLEQNPGFMADWRWIKSQFDVTKYQTSKGVIRRRMVSERNFRPPDWDFSWKSDRQCFLNIFDAFCHKWVLYGMEKDRPLLQKLSVNVTPHGTMIFIPRYWSFDSARDLRWGAITRLHHSRGVQKQGLKLGANQRQRRKQAQTARTLYAEATQAGMKGDKRCRWVIEKLGMHPDTDPKQLRRLLKLA